MAGCLSCRAPRIAWAHPDLSLDVDILSVIDLASDDVLATTPVGDGPNGIVHVPEAIN